MNISKEQVNAILSLPATERYKHFVKQVADRREVWGLYDEGWAMSADDYGAQYLALWPAQEYAELLKNEEWRTFVSKAIDLSEFLDETLADLAMKKIGVAVFIVPSDKGVVIDSRSLRDDIRLELEKYE